MNALAAGSLAAAGALTGIPIAAIAYAVPARGSIRLPRQWWHDALARPATVAATSILTGGAAGLVAGSLPLTPALPAFWLFAVLGIGLAITDLRQRRLPHAITGTLWIACSVGMAIESVVTREAHSLIAAILAGAAVALLALVIALALPGQLGLGDVSLSGVIAMSLGWLSWQAAVSGLVMGIGAQAVVALVKRAQGASRRSRVPFGPALLLGWLAAIVLWGI